MFTRSGSGFINDVDVAKLRAAKFDISRRTILMIHGYQGNSLFVLFNKQQQKREEEKNDKNWTHPIMQYGGRGATL